MSVLKALIADDVFDLARGCRVRIWADEDWKLDYKCLKDDPLDEQDAQEFRDFAECGGILQFTRKTVNVARLHDMAKARRAWHKVEYLEPNGTECDALATQLPTSTFIPIPWGCKGPVDLGWQNTSFRDMNDWDHTSRLQKCNIGLLAGRDMEAVEAGLIPNKITLIIDPDEPGFLEDFRRLNHHWLDQTFCVQGNRGCKWFFQVDAPGNEAMLKGSKILRRSTSGVGKPTLVGERLSSGEQGIIWGLHPAGRLYVPNNLPLLTIEPRHFRLPRNCYLSATADHLVQEAGGRYGGRRRASGSILDVSLLENKSETQKGTVCACPACREDGFDTAGDNLLLYPDGRYVCARFINEGGVARRQHNQRIYQLVGTDRRDYES